MKKEECKNCNGKGEIRPLIEDLSSLEYMFPMTCYVCKGTGSIKI